MNETGDILRMEAANWFVRLQAVDVPEADWLAFRDWLERDPDHAAAFAAVEQVWVSLDDMDLPAQTRVIPLRRRREAPPIGRRWAMLGAGATAAAAALAAVMVLPQQGAVDYVAPVAQPRTVQLADGSHVYLNRATQVRVALKSQRRAVELVDGEADFDVAHDPTRPFVIAAGDRQIRVLGTEFNVLRHDGRLTVTVKRGVVAVTGDADHPADTVTLAAGQQLDHVEGSTLTRVSQVDPQDALGWRRGVLVYRDRPLAEVTADLGRYLPLPVRVDPSAQGLKFTGLLFIDSEDAMMRRLEAFLPVTAERTSTEIRLKARGHS
jgi:transmembrane sensor